jgi:hypothetical protein
MNTYEFVATVRMIVEAESDDAAREQVQTTLEDVGFFEGLDR